MRRYLRFSLRGLLLATTIVAAGLGHWLHTARVQREAVAQIQAAGGNCVYQGDNWPARGSLARIARELLGRDAVDSVAHYGGGVEETAECREAIKRLPAVREVVIYSQEGVDPSAGEDLRVELQAALPRCRVIHEVPEFPRLRSTLFLGKQIDLGEMQHQIRMVPESIPYQPYRGIWVARERARIQESCAERWPRFHMLIHPGDEFFEYAFDLPLHKERGFAIVRNDQVAATFYTLRRRTILCDG